MTEAVVIGFLLCVCLITGAVAWVAMNYVESDVDRFMDWVGTLPER